MRSVLRSAVVLAVCAGISVAHLTEAQAKYCPILDHTFWIVQGLLKSKAGKYRTAADIRWSFRLYDDGIFNLEDPEAVYVGFWTQKGCKIDFIFDQSSREVWQQILYETSGVTATALQWRGVARYSSKTGGLKFKMKLKGVSFDFVKPLKITQTAKGTGFPDPGLNLAEQTPEVASLFLNEAPKTMASAAVEVLTSK